MTIDTKTIRLCAQAHEDVGQSTTADVLRRAADRIDAQATEIERLTNALEVARLQIEIDRDGLIMGHGVINALGVRAIPKNDARGQEELREYNKPLGFINAALAQKQGESNG